MSASRDDVERAALQFLSGWFSQPASSFRSDLDLRATFSMTDGALHATITGPEQSVHSGFIFAALEGYTGLTPVPLPPLFPPTRFRATFTEPGTYSYKCSLHDNLGMVGKVIVLP